MHFVFNKRNRRKISRKKEGVNLILKDTSKNGPNGLGESIEKLAEELTFKDKFLADSIIFLLFTILVSVVFKTLIILALGIIYIIFVFIIHQSVSDKHLKNPNRE